MKFPSRWVHISRDWKTSYYVKLWYFKDSKISYEMGCFCFADFKKYFKLPRRHIWKLGRDAFTSMNATGGITFSVIIMSLETQPRCLLSRKRMYLEAKRTSRKWSRENTSANSKFLHSFPQTLWSVVVYKHTLKCLAEEQKLMTHFEIVIKHMKVFF